MIGFDVMRGRAGVIVVLLGCGKSAPTASSCDPSSGPCNTLPAPIGDQCKTDKECRGAQHCWCDHEARPLIAPRCLDVKDLPAGTCISRAEWRQRDCVSQGKPSNCHDVDNKQQPVAVTATPIEPASACHGTCSGWRSDMPANARNPVCHRKERSVKQVKTGEEKCTTERKDKKDGTFESIKKCTPVYRSEPVEDDWCTFTSDLPRSNSVALPEAIAAKSPYWERLEKDIYDVWVIPSDVQVTSTKNVDSVTTVGCVHISADGKIDDTRLKEKRGDTYDSSVQRALDQVQKLRTKNWTPVPADLRGSIDQWTCLRLDPDRASGVAADR